MSGYPQPVVPPGGVQPAPKRVRAFLGGELVVDTVRALYVWEHASYPLYYVPLADVVPGRLVDEGATQSTPRGPVRVHEVRAGGLSRPGAARVHGADAADGLAGTVRIDSSAMDAWFEEDEEVLGHPRNPYTRIDVLRSSRHVRVQLDGVVLADSSSPVLLFETGLPTRFYLNRTDLDLSHLVPSQTRTACPYKGWTSDYWSVVIDGVTHADLAWSYTFPAREVQPIAGLVAFYDERVDTYVDGTLRERPVSPFSRRVPSA